MGVVTFEEKVKEIADAAYGFIWRSLRGDIYVSEPHLREVGGSYLEHRGKCLRPALLTLCCEATGGSATDALPAACAVEMFHTWTLMHDDLIDHDDMRRGRPTAHVRGQRLAEAELPGAEAAEYGRVLAILGGDYLHGAALEMLLRTNCPPEVLRSVSSRMAGKLNAELLSGEQLDVRLSFMPWEEIREGTIMEMMRGKTGALLAYCAETGAAIGEKTPPDVSHTAVKMAEFAHLCGLAFQMKDDLLGIFGDEAKFGKPIGSDIREGKRTLLMLRAIQRASDSEKACLMATLGRKDATAQEIADVRAIVAGTGAEKAVVEFSNTAIERALQILEVSLPVSPAKEHLRQWGLSMVARAV